MTDSPMSEANMSSRSESTIDRDQPSANGAIAMAPSAGSANSSNVQARSPHRLQQYSYYGAQPHAFKGKLAATG